MNWKSMVLGVVTVGFMSAGVLAQAMSVTVVDETNMMSEELVQILQQRVDALDIQAETERAAQRVVDVVEAEVAGWDEVSPYQVEYRYAHGPFDSAVWIVPGPDFGEVYRDMMEVPSDENEYYLGMVDGLTAADRIGFYALYTPSYLARGEGNAIELYENWQMDLAAKYGENMVYVDMIDGGRDVYGFDVEAVNVFDADQLVIYQLYVFGDIPQSVYGELEEMLNEINWLTVDMAEIYANQQEQNIRYILEKHGLTADYMAVDRRIDGWFDVCIVLDSFEYGG